MKITPKQKKTILYVGGGLVLLTGAYFASSYFNVNPFAKKGKGEPLVDAKGDPIVKDGTPESWGTPIIKSGSIGRANIMNTVRELQRKIAQRGDALAQTGTNVIEVTNGKEISAIAKNIFLHIRKMNKPQVIEQELKIVQRAKAIGETSKTVIGTQMSKEILEMTTKTLSLLGMQTTQ